MVNYYNMNRYSTKALLGLAIILLVACVPAKEFRALQDKHQKSEAERERFSDENQALNVKNSELDSKVKVAQADVDRLLADSLRLSQEFKGLSEEHNGLKKRYADLELAQNSLLNSSVSETKKLLKQLQENQVELQRREDALRELERRLNQRKHDLDKLQSDLVTMQTDLESRNARLLELERILSRKDSVVIALRKKVSDALLGFEGKGLTVTVHNGKVYVSLEEKLLFKSGSWEVDPKGADAIKKLADVLAVNSDINVMIEGHTDDVPYNGKDQIIDNWDLSVKRATSIVRIILQNKKVDPKRVLASGRSQFLPVDAAKTSEARQKNRRTEIILTPKLDELLDILDNK
ncbi:chemotaxis protein MotB [Williamwhitmania taraxaci]|uniref:Chemotaxis protein MotB n=2 Tax=Williamwhitmania taraxaci TaxID=1640674 RepID=A0A1G6QHI8_9BACT|nr:chemotaxis protein MotB [Williamwhitmania taraxaci]